MVYSYIQNGFIRYHDERELYVKTFLQPRIILDMQNYHISEDLLGTTIKGANWHDRRKANFIAVQSFRF